jgi:hypothetical protein
MESTQARVVKNLAVLASIWEDAEGLIYKVALLDGELAEARQAREVAEEKFCSLSDASADGARWQVVFKMEHRDQFEELSLLWAWGAELCLAIVGPSWVWSHLSTGCGSLPSAILKWLGSSLHFRWQYLLPWSLCWGHSPNETVLVEVMNELVAKFRRLEELCSWLEGPSTRPPDGLRQN